MQLTLKRRELKECVAGLGRIVGRKNTLPILGGVKFDVGTTAVAHATDLDQTAAFSFKDAEISGSGSFIAGFDQVRELAKGPDGDSIEFVLTGKDLTVGNPIAGQVVTRDFATMDTGEWPEMPAKVPAKPVEGFLEAFRRVAAFASTDATRYVLNGCYLDVSEQGVNKSRVVATDGRRLTVCNTMTVPISDSCIVTVTKFITWSQLKGDVRVGTAKKGDRVWFGLETGPWSYVLKTVDGTYPNYRQVIPAEIGNNTIVFSEPDCVSLEQILRTFPGDDTGLIALRPGAKGAVTICGRGKDDARETTVVLAQGSTYTGKVTAVGVNRHFLMDAIEAGFRKFTFTDEMSPLVSDDGKGGKHVLMPIRVPPVGLTATHHADQAGKPASTNEAVQQKKEAKMPVDEKLGKPETEGSALDKVLVAYEAARQKVREANTALGDIADAVKTAAREQRQQRAEIENFRAALSKLQTIRV